MIKILIIRIFHLLLRAFEFIFKRRIESQHPQEPALSNEIKESSKPKQITIEKSKFSPWPRSTHGHKPVTQELPFGYGEDRIVLQIRDPWWVHCYWEVANLTKDKLKESFGDEYLQASRVLRVYDVTSIIFNGFNAHRYFDISIGSEADNWYINVSSGRSFCVDLGLELKDGRFILILRSNTVTTPLDGPSWIVDEEWWIPDEEFFKLYGFGLFGSSPRGRRKRIGEHISSSGFVSKAKK